MARLRRTAELFHVRVDLCRVAVDVNRREEMEGKSVATG